MIPGATNQTYDAVDYTKNIVFSVSVKSTVGSANAVFSLPDNMTVFPQLSSVSIFPINPTIQKGSKIILFANPIGGTGVYYYQ